MPLGRKLRYGMVGGGPGAFIGAVHRSAIGLDGSAELVAGSFSSDPEKSQQQGAELYLSADRVYGSYTEMAKKEAALPEDKRIDFVTIVTPNFLHFDIARTFIEAGFHIVCDKPMTTTVEDAEALCRLVSEHDVVFALTHNYSGYPSGLREWSFEDLIEKDPKRIFVHAVKGMLPKNRLAARQITKLKVYAGPEHPHAAQKPEAMPL